MKKAALFLLLIAGIIFSFGCNKKSDNTTEDSPLSGENVLVINDGVEDHFINGDKLYLLAEGTVTLDSLLLVNLSEFLENLLDPANIVKEFQDAEVEFIHRDISTGIDYDRDDGVILGATISVEFGDWIEVALESTTILTIQVEALPSGVSYGDIRVKDDHDFVNILTSFLTNEGYTIQGQRFTGNGWTTTNQVNFSWDGGQSTSPETIAPAPGWHQLLADFLATGSYSAVAQQFNTLVGRENEVIFSIEADKYGGTPPLYPLHDTVTFGIVGNWINNPAGETVSSFDWDFGDGNSSNIINPSHSYATSGSFDVTCTITTSGGTVTESEPITITIDPLGSITMVSWAFDAGSDLQSTVDDTVTFTFRLPESFWGYTGPNGTHPEDLNKIGLWAEESPFTGFKLVNGLFILYDYDLGGGNTEKRFTYTLAAGPNQGQGTWKFWWSINQGIITSDPTTTPNPETAPFIYTR